MNATAETLPTDADGDGMPDIETESDLDRLLAEIQERTAALLEDPKRRYHDLVEWNAIHDLIIYAGRWHDADGNRLPVQPDPEPDVVNLSPEAVHPVDGEEPEFYDGLDGLYVSRWRVNGCVMIANPYLTGVYWRDNADEVASELGASSRLIAMAGYWLIAASRWNGLPIVPLFSAAGGFNPANGRFWISDGGNPFNDDEIRMCVYNYSAASLHATIASGSGMAKAPFYLHPAERYGEENRDVVPGLALYTAGQQPQTIIPQLIAKYNSPRFMREAYKWALNEAHAIDRGDGAPVPGYITPQEAGGEHSQAWYDEHEDGDVTKLPRFSSRGLLR